MQPLTQVVMSATVARLAGQLWQRQQLELRQQRRGLLVVVIAVPADQFQPNTVEYPTTTYFVARAELEPFLVTANVVSDPDEILVAVDSSSAETAVVLVVTDVGCGLYYVNQDKTS